MEKIKLYNGTTLDIQPGATEYTIQTVAASIDEVVNLFTDENLERYEILAEDGTTCAIYTKKYLKTLSAKKEEEGYLVTIVLADVDALQARVEELESTVQELTRQSAMMQTMMIQTLDLLEDTNVPQVIPEDEEEPEAPAIPEPEGEEEVFEGGFDTEPDPENPMVEYEASDNKNRSEGYASPRKHLIIKHLGVVASAAAHQCHTQNYYNQTQPQTLSLRLFYCKV